MEYWEYCRKLCKITIDMKITLSHVFVLSFAIASQPATAQTLALDSDSLIAPGAELRLISSQFSFTEGAAVDRRGNVYFTDQPNNKIWKYGTDDKLSIFLDSAGRSNGMYFDRKGNLVTCADEKDELWSISPDKKVTILVNGFMGHRLNGPNDCWVTPDGGIYFTDPFTSVRIGRARSRNSTGKRYIFFLRERTGRSSSRVT